LTTVAKKRQAGDLERVRARAVRFIREEISEGVPFPTVMASLTRMLKEEEEQIAKRPDPR
jgi:hypothetical protein